MKNLKVVYETEAAVCGVPVQRVLTGVVAVKSMWWEQLCKSRDTESARWAVDFKIAAREKAAGRKFIFGSVRSYQLVE